MRVGHAIGGSAPGHTVGLEPDRWLGPASSADRAVLASVEGPVLDVGCGPGRHVRALLDRGVPTLGIDVSPAAVRLARRRGATVLRRSVYDRVPGAGRWRTVLLLDGSIGIGGDPAALLARAGTLVNNEGTVVVEVAPPAVSSGPVTVRFDREDQPFRWARVGVDGLTALAEAGGLAVARIASFGDRWFGWSTR